MYGFIYEIAMKIIYYWYIIGQISVPEIMKKYILRILNIYFQFKIIIITIYFGAYSCTKCIVNVV